MPSSDMGLVGSKTWSPGHILGNSCLHSRDHICDPILTALDQKFCHDNIKANIEYRSCLFKTSVNRLNLRKFLFTL